jgi:predicted small metal-binding protein
MNKENPMARYYIDCRDYPSDGTNCTVALSANSRDELIEAVVQHGTHVHGYEDTPEFRQELKKNCKEGSPRA